ncbi:hypothetical protein AQI95_41885 [Streptomyces yokosukanensis]|uniref:Uncharacterized protein n=1 Tax=Streptomyces yokosukanensis TaxID=67386 RepID=A0A117PXM2_9ACTN|nr:hypothetical protein [Streptomyces yokosukanensis]KUM97373.1 hypothetical protein AQI95_41885 [Streptomyces yokosukanensis]
MAVISLVGLPGAPGVTSSALALLRAWPLDDGRRLVLAECDPDGGSVLSGALEGRVEADRGLRNLTESSRTQELVQAFWPQLIALENDERRSERNRLLLPGLTSMSQAASLAPVWGQLGDLFAGIEAHGHDVLVDLGRSGAFGPSGVLALRADAVLVVMRGTVRSLHFAQSRIAQLRALLDGEHGRGSGSLGIVLIKQGPYSAREVEAELDRRGIGTPVLATLPYRPEEAAVLSDGAPEGRGFLQGKLMSAARDATTPIRQRVVARRARLASPLHQRLMRGATGAR